MGGQTSLAQILPSVYAFLQKVAHHFPVEAAYVFGSFARGTASIESDIDLAVISSAFSGDRFADNVALSRFTWNIDTRIEPLAMRPESLASDSFLAVAIRNEGVPVSLSKALAATVAVS